MNKLAEFYTVITDAGREAVARATQAGEKVDITHFAVGDGGGVPVTPNESQTQLVNECWRGLVSIYKQEGTSLIIDTYIPADEESFTAREMGIFTADGVLFAVSNIPDMRKVLPSEGAVGNFTLGMVIDVTDIDMRYIEIHTDPKLDFIKNSEKGVADGVASLDSSGKVPESQLPELDFIPNDEKGQPNGVMPLNADGKADAKYLPQMDFYTKAETLANNTKTLFGLDASAVPDAVFNKLSRLDNKLADEYFWDVCKNVTNFYDSKLYESVYLSRGRRTGAETQTIYYSTEIEYSEGRVKLKNPQAVEVSYDNMPSADLLNGKYCICPQDKQNEPISTKVYRVVNISEIKRGADFSDTRKNYVIMVGTLYEQQAYTSLEHVKYISSPNRHPELPVGFENLFLGKLGEKATIKTGQYVGTGTYGESNPNSLSFEFEPKVLFLVEISTKKLMISVRQSNGFIFLGKRKPFTWDKNKIQWFDSHYASEQFNSLGKFYYYIVIG